MKSMLSFERAALRRSRSVPLALFAVAICLTISSAASAAVILDQTLSAKSSATGKDLAAHVVFDLTGDTLALTVTNIGAAAASPSDVLTGILWDFHSARTLHVGGIDFTNKTGSDRDRLMHSTGADSLGQHWQYLQFASPVGNEHYGVGASGLGGIFSAANFEPGGTSLQGVDYGIVNALDKKANKGTDVPLVSRSLTFTFTGLDVAGASSAPLQVTGLRLQFGSNMSEPALLSGNAIPEPTAIGLLSLTSMALLRRRR